jgi:hypothetical protein
MNESTTDKLNKLITAFTTDDEKFITGNASASTRARKALQEIIAVAKTRRTEITAEKNARKEAKASA